LETPIHQRKAVDHARAIRVVADDAAVLVGPQRLGGNGARKIDGYVRGTLQEESVFFPLAVDVDPDDAASIVET
jgi:hypothetical protein